MRKPCYQEHVVLQTFFKKHFAVLSILAPYHIYTISKSVQYVSVEGKTTMFSEVLCARLKQTKWLEDSGQANVSATAGNCPSRFQTYVLLYILPAHHSVQTFRSVYYSMPFTSINSRKISSVDRSTYD
jgi:hypothetical protein